MESCIPTSGFRKKWREGGNKEHEKTMIPFDARPLTMNSVPDSGETSGKCRKASSDEKTFGVFMVHAHLESGHWRFE